MGLCPIDITILRNCKRGVQEKYYHYFKRKDGMFASCAFHPGRLLVFMYSFLACGRAALEYMEEGRASLLCAYVAVCCELSKERQMKKTENESDGK